VISVLFEASREGLPVGEIKARLATDRSNARRAIRTLVSRGKVEQFESGGERRLRLAPQYYRLLFIRKALAMTPTEVCKTGQKTARRDGYRVEVEAKAAARAAARAEEQRRVEAEIAAGRGWIRYERPFARRHRRGPVQDRILHVLWRYSCPSLDEGLSVRALKAVLGGDRSNQRRAIRTMLERGELEEREDGERVRLAGHTVIWFLVLSSPEVGQLDEEQVRAVLSNAGEVVA
jgi:DNA-binding IclR family transcriptional regulator